MKALTGETNLPWVTIGGEGPYGLDYRCKEAECGAHKTIEKALPSRRRSRPEKKSTSGSGATVAVVHRAELLLKYLLGLPRVEPWHASLRSGPLEWSVEKSSIAQNTVPRGRSAAAGRPVRGQSHSQCQSVAVLPQTLSSGWSPGPATLSVSLTLSVTVTVSHWHACGK